MLFESFESRVLLSGNVSVKITDTQVRFIGDASSNALVIAYSANQLLVTGTSGTTIDGKSSRVYAARDNVSVSLGDGDDVATLQRFSGGFNLGVDLGNGNDAVYFKRSNILAADFFGGTGNDRADITDSTFSKRLRVFAGEQDDVTAMRGVRARRGLDITDTAGRSTVALKQVSASETSWVSGSDRPDDLTILDSDFTALSAKLKKGNDRAYVRGTTFAQPSPIDGGEGTNDIDREVALSSTFSSGSDGWSPGISNVSYDASMHQTVGDLYRRYGGTYGITHLPSGTPLDAEAFLVNARGDSFTTFGYLAKPVDALAGLLPNTNYSAQFRGRVVVDSPLSDAAAGVDFHFGGSAVKPRILDGGSLNLSIGTPDSQQTDLSFAGSGASSPATTWHYDAATNVLSYTHTHPTPIRTGSDGGLYVVAGATFNSGLVPGGATPNVYFIEISVQLTPLP